MSRGLRAAVVVAALLAAPIATASANPDFRSVINEVTPPQPGLHLQVLGFDQNFQLINRTGKVVLIRGYQHEPYARLLPDGTVQLNRNSPATYLNADRFGTTTVPPTAGANKPVSWNTIDKTGRLTWHDHRMHWMTPEAPPSVKDKSKKTKIFNYAIPLEVGGKPVAIRGTLFWVGPPGGGMPAGAIVAFGLIGLASVALVARTRRRRSATDAAPAATSPDDERRGRSSDEAW